MTFIHFWTTAHSCSFTGFHSIPAQKAQTLLDSTNLNTHSTLIPNGEASTAELSTASASENQESHPSSNTEAPAKPARSPELDGPAKGLLPGTSLSC